MDVMDLRGELHRRASELPSPSSTTARVAGVRRRVRARRQRLAVGVAGLAAVGVGVAAVLVPDLGPDATTQVQPAAPTRPEGPAAAPDLGTWPSRIDGNSLLAQGLSEPGRQRASWTLQLPTLPVALSVFCRLDEEAQTLRPGRSGPMLTLRINGRSDFGVSCGQDERVTDQGLTTEIDRPTMRRYGVRAGKPFTLTMAFDERDGAEAPRGRLGFGIYAQDGEERQVAPGWSIPVVRGVPGEETRLTEVFTAPVSRSRALGPVTTSAATPPGTTLSYGWLVKGYRGSFGLSVDGGTRTGGSAGGIVSGELIRGRHELVLRASGGDAAGTLMLAVYHPIDDE